MILQDLTLYVLSDDEDHEKFIAILDTYHKKIGYEIYAYCLVNNSE